MLTQALVIAAVVALLVVWARSVRGRAARALVSRTKILLVIPPLLWGIVWFLSEADLGSLDEPFLVIPRTGFALSGGMLLLALFHVAAALVVLLALGRAAGFPRASVLGTLVGLLLGQVLLWATMIGLIRLFVEIPLESVEETLGLLAVMAFLLVVLNVLLARIVVRLVASGGRLKPALGRLFRSERTEEAPLLGSVLLRLLVSGAIVVIWISSHTSSMQHETGWRTTTRSAVKLALDVQTVATVTCDNPWPRKVAESVERQAPEVLERTLDLATAFLSVLFLAAFVSTRARSQATHPVR